MLGIVLGLASCGDVEDRAAGAAATEVDAAWTTDLLVARTDPKSFLPTTGPPYVVDPDVGLRLEPDFSATWTWREHPRGRFQLQTNNLGLLEGEPTLPEKHGVRVLVLGDSHMMVVGSEESYPNLLETRLRAQGYPTSEVLNAGVGYTGPRLYLRRLERFLSLRPDVVVVSFFSGNDLWDDLHLQYEVEKSPRPALGPGYHARLERAREEHSAALYQGLNQAHFFKHWPGTGELGLRLGLESLEEMRALCEREGILFLVVILPTRIAVDVEDEPEERREALAILELSEDEATIEVRLVERLVAELARRGVTCLDPTAAMRADPTPFYWRKDHHLSVAGHAHVARAAWATFEPLFAERGWKTGK